MGQGLTYEIQIENTSTDDQRWRYTLLTLYDTVSLFPLLNCLTLLKHKHVCLYIFVMER